MKLQRRETAVHNHRFYLYDKTKEAPDCTIVHVVSFTIELKCVFSWWWMGRYAFQCEPQSLALFLSPLKENFLFNF